MGKGEIARNEQFLLFPQCFQPFQRTFCHLKKNQIVVCKLFQFGRVRNLSFGKGLNPLIATFQLSSAGSLNSGWSQNGVLGNGLNLNLPFLTMDVYFWRET